MKNKRLYIAGAYSSSDVIQVFENMRLGMKVATELFLKGHYPFVPWFDHHFFFMKGDKKITIEMIQEYSLRWLEVSDAMVVLPNWKKSKGTQFEIDMAKALGIPIYYLDKKFKHKDL